MSTRSLERWVGELWVSPELWAEGGEALTWALRNAAPESADTTTIALDGFSVSARDPEFGVKVFVTGWAQKRLSE